MTQTAPTSTPGTPGTAGPLRRANHRLHTLLGAGPLHLLAMLVAFTLAAAAATHVNEDPLRLRYVLWFIGAALAHDLVLFPAYSLLDNAVRRALRLAPRRRTARPRTSSPGDINYVRFPTALSGLLLLVFAPAILKKSTPSLNFTSELDADPYLVRWLLVTAALYLLSAATYGVHVWRRRAAEPHAEQAVSTDD